MTNLFKNLKKFFSIAKYKLSKIDIYWETKQNEIRKSTEYERVVKTTRGIAHEHARIGRKIAKKRNTKIERARELKVESFLKLAKWEKRSKKAFF